MKNIFFLFNLFVIITLFSCCKENNNCEPNCPLPNGEYCPNNMINVDDECVCPEGTVEFDEQCYEQSSENGYLINNLNCNCLIRLGFALSSSSNDCRVYLESDDFVYDVLSMSYIGTENEFSFIIQNDNLDCIDNGVPNYPEFVGIVENDSLFLTIYWREQGPNWNTPVDSCVGIVIPRL